MSTFPKRAPVSRKVLLPPPPGAGRLSVLQGGLAVAPRAPVVRELDAFREELSQYEGATWWSRVAAVFVDAFLIGLANIGLEALCTRVLGLPGFVASLGAMVVGYQYLMHFNLRGGGQTPGKKLMKIRVINLRTADGVFDTRKQVLVREYFGKVLSSVFLVGYLLPIFRKDKKALHDLMSETRVIRYS